MTRPTPSWTTRWRETSPSSTAARARTSSGTPASWKARTSSAAQRRAGGAGLRTAVEPEARAAATPPAGMASGKFHGEATTVTSTGSKRDEHMKVGSSSCRDSSA